MLQSRIGPMAMPHHTQNPTSGAAKSLEEQLCDLKLEFAAMKAALLDRQEERGNIIITLEAVRGRFEQSIEDYERRIFGLEQVIIRMENVIEGSDRPVRAIKQNSMNHVARRGWIQRVYWALRRS